MKLIEKMLLTIIHSAYNLSEITFVGIAQQILKLLYLLIGKTKIVD